MQKEINPTFALILRVLLFLVYLGLITFGVIVTQTFVPLLALLLIYWVVENITYLIPVGNEYDDEYDDPNSSDGTA